MTPTYGVSPSRPKHMVYLGYDDIKELRLYIHTDGDMKGTHITNQYSIDDTNKLKTQESKPSPRHMVQELGWFCSPESFSSICNDLDLPQGRLQGLDQPQALRAWVQELVQILDETCADMWACNNGNIL
ncbi:hypothetical protein EJ04DRAFT_529913 [Polyplosphaeria fusca]|uniref:Uncharacterized protein n=1 Tax=Polyplosphaeria fusca TaxID=682080 RepID=A0A9P4USL4_9PLEO|nr:hypothetical protein EJ04DRAFT_529913 [Polyplosphaeria fusca]